MKKILVVYKSVTGFTKQYGEWIAEELGCEAVDLKEASSQKMSEFDVIIFGGRFHAGFVDGLKKAKAVFNESKSSELIVFATGATPNGETKMIEEAWKNNFTQDELSRIPHFYMQSGLRYDKMTFGDKIMMRAFASMVRRKKEKSEYEKAMEQAVNNSYDISSKEYMEPLVSYLLKEVQNK